MDSHKAARRDRQAGWMNDSCAVYWLFILYLTFFLIWSSQKLRLLKQPAPLYYTNEIAYLSIFIQQDCLKKLSCSKYQLYILLLHRSHWGGTTEFPCPFYTDWGDFLCGAIINRAAVKCKHLPYWERAGRVLVAFPEAPSCFSMWF